MQVRSLGRNELDSGYASLLILDSGYASTTLYHGVNIGLTAGTDIGIDIGTLKIFGFPLKDISRFQSSGSKSEASAYDLENKILISRSLTSYLDELTYERYPPSTPYALAFNIQRRITL